MLQLQLQAAVLAGSIATVAAAAELRPATHKTQARSHSKHTQAQQDWADGNSVLAAGTWSSINQLAHTKRCPGTHI